MPPAPAKPITAAEFYDTLLDTDRIVATRTADNQPDITKRVGLLPPVALVDYLAGRLYRGGNNAGVPVKVYDFYDTTEPGFDPLKHSALTTADPAFLCLKTRAIIVNPRPNQPSEYTVEYTTFSATTFRVWRDGRFSQSGQQSDALWYPLKSPEAAAPEWASLQAAPPVASYNFPVKFLLRHPFAGNQLFFETKVAGVLPAPSLADGDANYLRVARETVPVPAFDAFQGDYNPQINAPALTAAVGTRGHYYRVSQPGVTVNTTSTTATSASTALSVTSAAGLTAGMRLTGAGIAAGTTIGAIVGTALTLSAPATVAANTPVTAETFAVGLTGFVVGSEIFYNGTAWTLRSVPGAATGGGGGPATTDALPEGATNKYYLDTRAALKADLVGGIVPVAQLPQLGATEWVAGQPIAAGQLKFNSLGVLFYAKAAITNPQAQPFVFNSATAANALYERAYSGAQFWSPTTAYKQGQVVQSTYGFEVALYVCNLNHTSPVQSAGVDFFSEALTARWNLVSRAVGPTEIIPGPGESRSLLPAVFSLQTYRAHATGTFTLLADPAAIGRTKAGQEFTIVITQSRTGGVTFDAGTFANQPRLSGAGGTDILRFYTDAAGKLFCWSDGQGLVGGTGGGGTAPAARQFIDISTVVGGTTALTQSGFMEIPLSETLASSGPGLTSAGRIVIPVAGRWDVGVFAQVLAGAGVYSQVSAERQAGGAGEFVSICTASITAATGGYGANGASKPVTLGAGDVLRMTIYTEGAGATLQKGFPSTRPYLVAQQLPA